MIADNDMVAAALFNEVIVSDCYQLRRLSDRPECMLDIGANAGFFSVYARMLFPAARICACEPNPHTFYTALVPNTAGLNIATELTGLGDGRPVAVSTPTRGISDGRQTLWFQNSTNTATLPPSGDEVTVPTKSFEELVSNTRPETLFVKSDCEGAERFLLEDGATKLLGRCTGFGIEVHEPSEQTPVPDCCPQLARYAQWAQTLSDSHVVTWRGCKDSGTAVICGVRR